MCLIQFGTMDHAGQILNSQFIGPFNNAGQANDWLLDYHANPLNKPLGSRNGGLIGSTVYTIQTMLSPNEFAGQ